MPVNTLLQMRRGSAATWTSTNPTLSAGEWGYETDTGRAKVGDGSTVWTSLKYAKLRYDDLITGSGVSITELTDGNSQVTGLSFSSDLAAGDNITLTESNGTITINGQAGITLSEGTGIHIVVDGADHEINVSGLTSNNIGDFVDAVNDRIDNLLVGGENIQLSYTDNNNNTSTLDISVTGLNSADISDFDDAVDARVTAASISAEEVMDIVGTGIIAGTGIVVSYDTNAFDGQVTIDTSGLAYTDHNHDLVDISDVNATATEVNILDGDTTPATTTLASNDGVVVNDGGTMKQVLVDDFDVYGASTTRTLTNKTINGPDNTLTNIANSSLSNSSVTVGSTEIALGASATTIAGLTSVTSTSFVGDLTGNADTADQVKTQQGSTDANHYITFVDSDNGSATAETVYTDAGLYYNPSSNNLNIGNNLTVGGDLVVNGTTTTVNSTVVTIEDPVFVIGSGSPTTDDNKDRGIEFNYYDGSAKVGFFGYDDSTGKFTFFTDATNSSEVFSGTKGELDANVDWSNLLNISIDNDDISASAGIDISKLSASGLTIGDSTYVLGDTTTALSGMTSFAGTSAANPVYLHYAVIDGGSP